MFSIFLRCKPGEEDLLTAELWGQQTDGIADEPGGLRAFFDDDERVSHVLHLFRSWGAELRIEAQTDWTKVSQDAWPPMLVGDKFFLVPPWRDDAAPGGRIRLEIYPGMACGTGHHPATQLCLEAMERCVTPGATVIDVGSGSGILSDAARLLGAGSVIGCDIDHDNVEISRQRVGLPVFTGSIDAVQSGIADVIVANISSDVIESLHPEMERVRKAHHSTLILSGFPDWDCIEGFDISQKLQRQEWVCVVSSNF